MMMQGMTLMIVISDDIDSDHDTELEERANY